MTETIEPMAAQIDQQRLTEDLVAQAREEGVQLVGEGGLLTGLTKAVVETALEEEISGHLGYDKHDPVGRTGGNSRNGVRAKTVLTEIGPVQIEVTRDRDGSFDPQIVRKRQRRLDGIDEIVLSLTARGLTTGEVSAHFAEVYGAKVSKGRALSAIGTKKPPNRAANNSPFYNVDVSPDGTLIATATEAYVTVWDPGTGTEVFSYATGEQLDRIGLNSDGSLLAVTSSGDGTTTILDRTGRTVEQLRAPDGLVPYSVSFSPDGEAPQV